MSIVRTGIDAPSDCRAEGRLRRAASGASVKASASTYTTITTTTTTTT